MKSSNAEAHFVHIAARVQQFGRNEQGNLEVISRLEENFPGFFPNKFARLCAISSRFFESSIAVVLL